MAQIDNLEIKIVAEATSAIGALDALESKLTALSGALSGLNTTGLNDLASGVSALTSAMVGMKGINGNSVNAIVNNINNLNKIDSANFYRLANNLRLLSDALITVSASASSASDVIALASAISKFGSASMAKAVTNLPALTNALVELFTRLATAPKVGKDVTELVNALTRFVSMGSKVGTTSRAVSSAFTSASSGAKRTTKAFGSLTSAIGKFYATWFLVIRAIKGIWKSAQFSMDYIETFNYFDVALDKVQKQFKNSYEKFGYEDADTYAESFSERLRSLANKMTGFEVGENGVLNLTDKIGLGLDAEQLLNYQAKILGVTNSVGVLGETSINAAKGLSMLAGDLSSLTNTDLSEVMSNLQSGLIGQSRALYKYGIDITAATLEQYAFANGVTKSVSEMSQSEKMQLRLLAILDQSKVAWTDQARTINSSANQYRIFQQQVKNLGRVLGNLLMPIVERALPVLNGMVIALQRVFTMLGFKIYGDNWLSDLMTDADKVAMPIEEIEEDFDGATAAAKKFKQQLLGIDEINLLSTDNKDSAGLDTQIDLWKEIKLAVGDYEEEWNKALADVQNKAEEFADMFTKPFMDADGSVTNLIDSLKALNEELDVFGGDKTGAVSKVIRAISDVMTLLVNSITVAILAIKSIISLIRGDMDGAAENVNKMIDALSRNNESGKDLAEILGFDTDNFVDEEVFVNFKINVEDYDLEELITKGIGATMLGTGTNTTWIVAFLDVLDTIRKIREDYEYLQKLFNTDEEPKYVIDISDCLEKVFDWLVDIVIKAESFNEALEDTIIIKPLNKIAELIEKIDKQITDKFNGIVDKMKDIGKNIMQGLMDGLKKQANPLKDTMEEIADKGLIKTIKEKLGIHSPSRVFYEIGGYTMQGLENGMEAMYGSVSNSLERFSGSLSVSPNTSMSMPSASNTSFRSASAADISGAVYDAVTSALSAMNTNVNVTLEGDARGIFNVVQKSARDYANRTGNPAFI